MGKSILIGPVPGIPSTDSVTFIVTQVLDGIADMLEVYRVAESFAKNESKGLMMVHIKPHEEENIDDLFIPLARRAAEVSGEIGHEIPCRKVDRDFESGDNEGDVPCTPVVGPPKGPPTLQEHEAGPEKEYLAAVDLPERPPDWWKNADD